MNVCHKNENISAYFCIKVSYLCILSEKGLYGQGWESRFEILGQHSLKFVP